MDSKSSVVALVRRDFPGWEATNLKDDEVLDALLQAGASGSSQVLSFLTRHNIHSGFFLSWRQTKQVEQQVKLLDAALAAAAKLHEMDNILAAQARGIPRDVYSAIVVEEHATVEFGKRKKTETDEHIRLKEAERQGEADLDMQLAQNALSAAILTHAQPYELLAKLRDNLFLAYDIRARLRASNDPEKDSKLRIIEAEIRRLETDYNERLEQGKEDD